MRSKFAVLLLALGVLGAVQASRAEEMLPTPTPGQPLPTRTPAPPPTRTPDPGPPLPNRPTPPALDPTLTPTAAPAR